MPIPITVVSPYPYVGKLPGVPQLARAANFVLPPLLKLFPQAKPQALFHPSKAAPIWGVFLQDGLQQAIFPDSILALDNRNEYRVSNYPVQQGQFASYNKVVVPFELAVRMVKGGTLQKRTQFLADCQATAEALDLFTVITPEKTYLNCNVTRYSLTRRETKGAFFVDVDLHFTQIIQVTPQYSSTGSQDASTANAQAPAAQPVVNQGIVQPQNVGTQAQQQALLTVATGGTSP